LKRFAPAALKDGADDLAKDNLASAGLARSLGHQGEKEFRYVVYAPPDP
jgi:hypothetical protein